MGMSAISTETLSLGYGDAVIIDELNLTIPKGEITVFIGSNGCGKSTLLRSLARLMKPRGGSVLLEGRAIAKLASFSHHEGAVLQFPLYIRLPVFSWYLRVGA